MKCLIFAGLSMLLLGCLAPLDSNPGSGKDCVNRQTGDSVVTQEPKDDGSETLSREDWVKQEYGYEFDAYHSLFSYTSPRSRPEKEIVFEHDGRGVSVLQVIPVKLDDETTVNRVLAWVSDSHKRLNGNELILSILTRQEYVDDELVTGGFYTFAGTYTYETREKMSKTVRAFVDLSQGPVASGDRRRKVVTPAEK